MLKPIRWKTFPLDFLRIQIGFALYGLSISLMIKGNLGTGAWAVLDVALSKIFEISVGRMTMITGFVVLVAALLMREKVGWGTLGNILSIGPWLDLFSRFIPNAEGNLPMQFAMLLGSVFLMGNASAIYIGVDAGAGPRDSMMLAINRVFGVSVRVARTAIELTVIFVGWLLGGPAGIGTAVFALLIGPAVQWGFKVFRVEPHKEEEGSRL
ncbi:MAG: hypothetical protein HN855_08870 [Anaerolineae bacterium]|jgi:uncharacterized protein|nr:hypothetical protein [Anaerolineae bacterium]MBT7071075.1 hypothetical protein [Anaerolineae bacterium]MBT7325257.1 hypothetical protein [Anaerolineae bacterium]